MSAEERLAEAEARLAKIAACADQALAATGRMNRFDWGWSRGEEMSVTIPMKEWQDLLFSIHPPVFSAAEPATEED